MLRGGMRCAAEGLMLGTALFQAGCAGTPVRFVEPAGARVRIDDGPPDTIPFERSVSLGSHRVEIEAPPGWKAAGEEGAAPSARGVLLVLESPGEKSPEIRIGEGDLRWSLRGGTVQCSWADDQGRDVGYLKASAGGVAPDDPDVRGAQSRWEEGKAALQARTARGDDASREKEKARALRRDQKQDEGRDQRHHRNVVTAWKIVAGVVVVVVVLVVILLRNLAHASNGF